MVAVSVTPVLVSVTVTSANGLIGSVNIATVDRYACASDHQWIGDSHLLALPNTRDEFSLAVLETQMRSAIREMGPPERARSSRQFVKLTYRYCVKFELKFQG